MSVGALSGVLGRGLRAVAQLALLVAATACGSTPTSPTPAVVAGDSRPPTNTTPAGPSLACPADVSVASPSGGGVVVTFSTPAATGGVAPVTVSCAPASGASFPVGSTTVRCTAVDGAAQSGSCTFTVTVTPPSPRITRTSFLAFGDSMTLGEVTAPVGPSLAALLQPGYDRLVIVPAASYPTQLLTLLSGRYRDQAASFVMTNAGRPGEWAVDGALRFPSVLATSRADAVLLLHRANDLSALGPVPTSRGLEEMAREARFRGARVFLATLPPPRAGGRNALPVSSVVALNDRLRVIALGEQAALVDLYAALASNITTYIGTDGLHPTEAGYRRMAEAFFEAIQRTLEAPAPSTSTGS
ncbi:MAG: GDSL-type esterase/lipase family protein [Acidobacteriota bacterium]